MFKKLVQVTRQRHQDVTLSPVISYEFAEKLHSVPLALAEFPSACSHLPIVFIKEQDELFPYLMLGLMPGQNLCVSEKKSWVAGYIPWAIKRYPFSFMLSDDKQNLVLFIDDACGLFTERTGETLFDQTGKPGKALDQALELLKKYREGLSGAKKFCEVLDEFDLIDPLTVQIHPKDSKPIVLKGLYYVNENKLRQLSDDKYLQLRHQEMIQFIYYHLLSLQNMNLLQVRNRTLTREAFSDEASIPDSFDFGG